MPAAAPQESDAGRCAAAAADSIGVGGSADAPCPVDAAPCVDQPPSLDDDCGVLPPTVDGVLAAALAINRLYGGDHSRPPPS